MSKGPPGADTWWLWIWRTVSYTVPSFPLCCHSLSGNKHQGPPGPLPERSEPISGLCAHYPPTCIVSPWLAWLFIPARLAFHGPGVWSHKSRCAQIPGNSEKQSTISAVAWFTHPHPNNYVLLSTWFSCLRISLTSLMKFCIWHFQAYRMFKLHYCRWSLNNKTWRGPNSWGELPVATS